MKKKCIFGLLAAFFLIGCSGTDKTPLSQESLPAETTLPATKPHIVLETEEPEPEPEPETMPQGRIEVEGQIQSYLTGEMKPVEIANRRPMAIMISNDKQALPQYGMNRADIVYEVPVEGTMNRYLMLLEAYDDLERIGSVRSARTVYTYLAREWDAILAHFGQSNFAVPYLNNVDNINALDNSGSNFFYRTKDRKKPHNAYTSGSLLQEAAAARGYREGYREEYEAHFSFYSELTQPEGARPAYKVVPGYPYNKPWFEYDEETGEYLRYQYGKVHQASEGPLTVRNIIIQYHGVGYYDRTPYLNIDLHSETKGYYITAGGYIPVTVKREGEFATPRYYDASGSEIVLNEGKTWFCLMNAANYHATEIFDKDGAKTNEEQ